MYAIRSYYDFRAVGDEAAGIAHVGVDLGLERGDHVGDRGGGADVDLDVGAGRAAAVGELEGVGGAEAVGDADRLAVARDLRELDLAARGVDVGRARIGGHFAVAVDGRGRGARA